MTNHFDKREQRELAHSAERGNHCTFDSEDYRTK